MALTKTPVSLNFAKGLDTKSDTYQVPIGQFLRLVNSVFDVTNRLTKRNGFRLKTTLPDAEQTTLTTLNDSLIATGSNLLTYNEDINKWLDQGVIQPVEVETQSVVRNNGQQTSPDAQVTAAGLCCTTFIEDGLARYIISDSETGQQIVPSTILENAHGGTGYANPRVFILNRYFIITAVGGNGSGGYALFYKAIPISDPQNPLPSVDISSTLPADTMAYDGYVANNALYLAFQDVGSVLKLLYLSATLLISSPVILTSETADFISVTADITGATPTVWLTWNRSNVGIYTIAYAASLSGSPLQAKTLLYATVSIVIAALTSVAYANELTVFYDVDQDYGPIGLYPVAGVRTDFIGKVVLLLGGSPVVTNAFLRSVGLASKAFRDNSGSIYVLVTYAGANQPTYFLIDSGGNIYARLAAGNSGGYMTNQVLPSISLVNDQYIIAYRIKTQAIAVNKGTALPAGTPVGAVYGPTGLNLMKLLINSGRQYSSEIANSLHLTGGQLWQYDGVKPVELGFQIYPEDISITKFNVGGNMAIATYYYVFTYEWTDNQGNIHRSAPSIPYQIVATTATTSVEIDIPTLRLTYKTGSGSQGNPVRIVGYRWSTLQQQYYQFTSILSPNLNNPAVDFITFNDTLADSAILGNTLLYTTGAVIENNAPPASIASALFKNRVFLISAEDRNLLYYSKPVVQNTPVEFSDLFTIYVAPTSGSQGSTGDMSAISAMDDKFIIFKPDAIYYITGDGPDLTGANNNFSEPIFITSSVGCANPESIVLTPKGLMFQSDKGIWLLGRNLETVYIGSPVELYNDMPVRSAKAIPATNQVRFILANNITLMYDYFYDQWGTFTNIRAISSTLQDGLHTYLNNLGQVFQETPGVYLDGSSPVLMSFTTSWISLAGLQGYERFYEMNLLGTYYTPFKLDVQLAYDYKSTVGDTGYTATPEQSVIVTPDNYNPNWGGEALWGSGEVWGGPANVFEARVFPEKQKCETFQITVNEVYDSTYGVAAGQGLSLSGLNMIVGVKKANRTSTAKRSFG